MKTETILYYVKIEDISGIIRYLGDGNEEVTKKNALPFLDMNEAQEAKKDLPYEFGKRYTVVWGRKEVKK